MGSATVEEYIDLLSAEQHVDLQKLRDFARHGVQPDVRGEVWLYLMGVLSDDKGQEMTAVRSKYLEYEQMDKHNPALEKRIRSECSRFYQKRLAARPPPGRTLMQSTRREGPRRPDSNGASTSYSRIHGEGESVGSASGAANNAIVASLDRGPNRVNDGRIHALGGIIGDNGVTAAMDADDPEAVAAAELKRFGHSVENVICAYLNRCRRAQREQQQSASSSSSSSSHPQDQPQSRRSPDADGSGGSSPYHAAIDAASDLGAGPEPLPGQYEWMSQPPRGAGQAELGAREGQQHPYHPVQGHHRHAPPSGLAGIGIAGVGRFEGGGLAGSLGPGGGLGDGWAIDEPLPFHPALVYLCAPFVKCIRVEAGMYFAFEKLMTMMVEYTARRPLPLQVATFLTLFRTTLPELHSYFEEEEVDIISFATNWLQHLLAGELRIEDLMRLWDTYFAVPDPLDLHLYVCIAILTNCKDSLEELDRSETRSMLYSLPPLDIDRVEYPSPGAALQKPDGGRADALIVLHTSLNALPSQIINEAINIRLTHQQSLREEEEEAEAVNGR